MAQCTGNHSSFKEDLLARVVWFYQSLLTSPFTELAIIVRPAAEDLRSTMDANNRPIYTTTGLVVRTTTSAQVRRNLRRRQEGMTDEEQACWKTRPGP